LAAEAQNANSTGRGLLQVVGNVGAMLAAAQGRTAKTGTNAAVVVPLNEPRKFSMVRRRTRILALAKSKLIKPKSGALKASGPIAIRDFSRKNWRRRPDLNRRWRFCRLGRIV
jgi:hypothetical protein